MGNGSPSATPAHALGRARQFPPGSASRGSQGAGPGLAGGAPGVEGFTSRPPGSWKSVGRVWQQSEATADDIFEHRALSDSVNVLERTLTSADSRSVLLVARTAPGSPRFSDCSASACREPAGSSSRRGRRDPRGPNAPRHAGGASPEALALPGGGRRVLWIVPRVPPAPLAGATSTVRLGCRHPARAHRREPDPRHRRDATGGYEAWSC